VAGRGGGGRCTGSAGNLVPVIPYYDKDGEPITDLMEWGRLFEDKQYKFVGSASIRSEQGTTFRVSTVWMGMNHQYHPAGPPLIFETMVFIDEAGAEDVNWLDTYCDRYSTEAEAQAGHQAMIELVKGACTVTELVEHDAFA
jgi:hypothetical protein